MPEAICLSEFPTPWGTLMLADLNGRLALCDWISSPHFKSHLSALGSDTHHCLTPLLNRTAEELTEYIEGHRRVFDLPLADASTPFMTKVRAALLTVPYGETTSYKALAAVIGLPSGARAVARGVALNPLSIIVPCHRVIGCDGKLTGYAGGLAAKAAMLTLERL